MSAESSSRADGAPRDSSSVTSARGDVGEHGAGVIDELRVAERGRGGHEGLVPHLRDEGVEDGFHLVHERVAHLGEPAGARGGGAPGAMAR